HPGDTGVHVADQLALRPGVAVDLGVRDLLEQPATAVVVTRPVVPVPAVGRLELDRGQGVADRVGGTPDQYGRRVVAGDLPQREDPAEGTGLLLVVVDPAAGRAVAVDGAVQRRPQARLGLGPAVERRAIEHGHQVRVAVRVAPAAALGRVYPE